MVEVEGDAGQVAEIFQQGEQREKDGHRRQHHRHHPAEHPPNPLHQHLAQPLRGVQREQQGGHRPFQRGERLGEDRRGDVCPADGQPEDAEQQEQHHRHAGFGAEEEAVEAAVQLPAGRGRGKDAGRAELFGAAHQRGHRPVQQRLTGIAACLQLLLRQVQRAAHLLLLGKVKAQKAFQRVQDALVRAEQPQRHPAGGQRFGQEGTEGFGKILHHRLNVAGQVGRQG